MEGESRRTTPVALKSLRYKNRADKNFKICRPYGADNLFGFGFYKDVTPTAFGIGVGVPFGYDERAGEEIIISHR